MKIVNNGGTLTVFLSGEIDHHTAAGIRLKADTEIIKQTPQAVVLDFSDVSFMDSSGVGLVMGRYKLCSSQECSLSVTGLKERDRRILMMSGMQNKIEFR